MLTNSPCYANIPVTDLAKAREFYEKKLGLKVENESMSSVLLLSAGEGTKIMLYERPKVEADNTFASFVVDDIYKSIEELKAQGIKFESYQWGEMKTDDKGVMSVGSSKAAWFKDIDGHILALNQKM